MKEKPKYTCDKCAKPIDGNTAPIERDFRIIGECDLYVLEYHGDGNAVMGDNRFPPGGFHFHGYCFDKIVEAIVKEINRI